MQNRYYIIENSGRQIRILSSDRRVIVKNISCKAGFLTRDNKILHYRLKLSDFSFSDDMTVFKAEYLNSWFRMTITLESSPESPEIIACIVSTWYGEAPDILIHETNSIKPEYITAELHFPVSLPLRELYLKNRTYRKRGGIFPVWLDKQGLSLGRNTRMFHLYHVPGISSLLYHRIPHKLTIYADHAHDHRFVKASQTEDTIVYSDHSHTILHHTQELKVHFRFLAGFAPDIQPLLWLHSKGHDATMIWTWHPDNSNLGSTMAVTMGSSSVDPEAQPTGGFAAYKIPVTQGVFYSTDNDKNISLFNHPDSEAYRTLTDRLRNEFGFEIVPHSASSHISNKDLTDEALQYFYLNYGNNNWIDHSGHGQRTTLSGEGADINSESYIIDLFEKYGVKYAWHYGSELKYLPGFAFTDDSHGLDLLQGGRLCDKAKHTPLFWKHPSYLKQVTTWKTMLLGRLRHFPVTGLQWLVFFHRNIPGLIRNHGVSIIHDYPCWTYKKRYATGNGYYKLVKEKDREIYISDPDFDALLARLAELDTKKSLHCTTVKLFLDYVELLDKLSFSFKDKKNILVTNSSDSETGAIVVFPAGTKPASDNIYFLRRSGTMDLYLLTLDPGATTMISTH